MALHVPKAPGFSQMMKEGSRYFSGLEEAVIRNIEACKQFSETLRTAYGPNGMNKMVINHLEKLFVTSDAATIIRELDIEHPAARIMVLGSQMQEQEVGDGTNFVIIFAGALLEHAQELIKMGLTPIEIAEGYEEALKKALEIMPTLVVQKVKDFHDSNQVERALKSVLMSKLVGDAELLTSLVTKACVNVLPEKQTSFNVDNIRVCKILGGGLSQSEVVSGIVFKRQVEGNITKMANAKIAVYTCPVDVTQTETKGTVLLKTADELMKFSRGEESVLEEQIKSIADSGATVVVAGGKFGDMALHYLDKYNIMAVRLLSKFDLRRLCRATGATALARVVAPSPEELGFSDEVKLDEIGETPVVVFHKKEAGHSVLVTVVLRGSTDAVLDDAERAIDDGVNAFKALTKDGRLVAGAGAFEIELSRSISAYGETKPGLEQYAIERFAFALESLPKALADNSGIKGGDIVAQLHAAHQEGKSKQGLDLDNGTLIDAVKSGILDLFAVKYWGLRFAVGAAATILRVDQIIMAKRAGGPVARPQKPQDEED